MKEQPRSSYKSSMSSEFKFDPDFLSKINANMAQNDMINQQTRESKTVDIPGDIQQDSLADRHQIEEEENQDNVNETDQIYMEGLRFQEALLNQEDVID